MSEVFVFLDESLRAGRYLLACVTVEEEKVGAARRQVGKLLLRGQRTVHFQDEGDRRRRQILDALSEVAMTAIVYSCRHRVGRGAERARVSCLALAVADLQATERSAHLFIESRETADRFDRATIVAARARTPILAFEHLRPYEDPLIWLPDAIAWAIGAGGEWKRRVDQFVSVQDIG